MSEYCQKCGEKTSEDDSRLCANCTGQSSLAEPSGSAVRAAEEYLARCPDPMSRSDAVTAVGIVLAEAREKLLEVRAQRDLFRSLCNDARCVLNAFAVGHQTQEAIDRAMAMPNAKVSEVAVADQTKTRGVRPPLSLD